MRQIFFSVFSCMSFFSSFYYKERSVEKESWKVQNEWYSVFWWACVRFLPTLVKFFNPVVGRTIILVWLLCTDTKQFMLRCKHSLLSNDACKVRRYLDSFLCFLRQQLILIAFIDQMRLESCRSAAGWMISHLALICSYTQKILGNECSLGLLCKFLTGAADLLITLDLWEFNGEINPLYMPRPPSPRQLVFPAPSSLTCERQNL